MAPAHISSRYHQSLSNQFYLQKNCHSHRRRQIYDAFSTETRLELTGIAGSVRLLWMLSSLAKIRRKKDRQGSPVASPMPKSVLSGGRENQLLRE